MKSGRRSGAVAVLVPSLLMFGAVVLTGRWLERSYGINLLTRSSVMALSWLAVGPWLYRDARRLSTEFLQEYRRLFPNDDSWSALLTNHLRRMSLGWLWFGVPWSIVATTAVVGTLYPKAEGWALLWVVFSFGGLFLISGLGFCGVWTLVRLVQDFASANVAYRPYHPDRFGGLAAVGTFSVRGALYFSSGALVLPLAFDAIAVAQGESRLTAMAVAYLVTGVFVVFVIAAFALPVAEIKRFADAKRVRVTDDARSQLSRLIEAYSAKPTHDEQLSHQINICYQMECCELDKLREYPYDFKIISEMVIAIALPIGVVILEAFLR